MKNAIERNGLESSLLFKITLVDGSTQLIPVSEQQARSLGLHTQSENKIVEETPVIPSRTQTEEPDQNGMSEKAEDNKESHFVYKIIKPEDLNLKPITKKNISRGRPRKRRKKKSTSDNTNIIEEAQKIVKQVRTRSGRITKPPKHIEKDFKKIDISDDLKNDLEKDLKIIEFEPLTTNETPKDEPLQCLEQHSRKRSIPRRYRCPTCNKAYLGRLKMMSHIHKHPDHGPISKYCKIINNTTWNFLIVTSQKYKDGEKGAKFCQELDVLLQNARTLAQYLFKPVENNESGYFINETLAHIFRIPIGNYKIDEAELNRDISLLDYLENSGTSKGETTKDSHPAKSKDITTQQYDSISAEKTNASSLHDNVPVSFKSFEEYMLESNETHVSSYENEKINYTNDTNIQKDGINMSNINSQQTNHTNIEFPIPNSNHNIIMDKEQIKTACADTFLTSHNPQNSISNSNCLAVVKYEVQPKHGFHFDGHPYDSINNDLHSVMDTNHLENLASYHNVSVKEGSVFDIDTRKPDGTAQHMPEKHNSHITLQNELHDVDELILVNDSGLILPNDTAQVSNMLDTSTNSDDIMNVDQFVNERFKKLTEHTDIDIQNNLLNIELPPLDIFHFHTS